MSECVHKYNVVRCIPASDAKSWVCLAYYNNHIFASLTRINIHFPILARYIATAPYLTFSWLTMPHTTLGSFQALSCIQLLSMGYKTCSNKSLFLVYSFCASYWALYRKSDLYFSLYIQMNSNFQLVYLSSQLYFLQLGAICHFQ